ncbi:hypothetical protein F2Q70_00004096 [Brassica cretica]|uniref:Uncharacterized protein n=1 Tax=Brassica cretica TaxID=69181 RepID=A0A8S9IU41_BRACR|nr:hypothetical protein F2Q70_00004096 [Brassica cretica]
MVKFYGVKRIWKTYPLPASSSRHLGSHCRHIFLGEFNHLPIKDHKHGTIVAVITGRSTWNLDKEGDKFAILQPHRTNKMCSKRECYLLIRAGDEHVEFSN